ncbi:GntR family transcriptional regulator [Streptomyces cellulosae]|nr:GntR family transcriptional regulator [Streptomyces sp. MD20-1-1]MYQ29882.1 GntR family transcriptional regulator [Streptomyces sp. SID4956]WSB88739.1 GntR family transcriptional regulator [Streptomyces cellulosae]WTB92349.1 GntR family transcriptional regulator [Streptomyces cellulosae]
MIVDQIRTLLREERLQPGDRLPSERARGRQGGAPRGR